MTAIKSSLKGIQLEGADLLFIIVNESQFGGSPTYELKSVLPVFSETLGPKVKIVMGHPGSGDELILDVKSKAWPSHIEQVLAEDSSPILLILEKSFDDFEPSSDDWYIVRFGEARKPETSIPHFFDALSRGIKRSQPLSTYLNNMREGETGLARFGQVIFSSDPSLAKTARSNNCLDPSWKLVQTIIEIAEEKELVSTDGKIGYLVREAIDRLHKLNGFDFGEGGVKNALRANGVRNQINQTLRAAPKE